VKRYAAFLRGVNLAGKRKTSSKDLVSCLKGLGLEDVAAFRASGNVVFATGESGGAEAIAKRLERGLQKSFGFEVPVYLRSAAQVNAIAAHEPFPAKRIAAAKGKLQVALLLRPLSAAKRKQALAMETEDDLLAVKARELYWLPSGGTQDSELNLDALAKITGPWTMRTMGTMELIAAKFFAG
jgi:uncharacterized protein (DUF1697 family)